MKRLVLYMLLPLAAALVPVGANAGPLTCILFGRPSAAMLKVYQECLEKNGQKDTGKADVIKAADIAPPATVEPGKPGKKAETAVPEAAPGSVSVEIMKVTVTPPPKAETKVTHTREIQRVEVPVIIEPVCERRLVVHGWGYNIYGYPVRLAHWEMLCDDPGSQ